MTYIYPLACGV